MSTPASIKKHPLHPMLIAFPIGLWTFSLICDLVSLFGWNSEAMRLVAFYTLAGGIIGALIAAIPGIIDYASIQDRRTKRVATAHMIINLIAVVVFVVDLSFRIGASTSQTLIPFWLSVSGVVLISISGWLGGELVYVLGMAVEGKDTYKEVISPDSETTGNGAWAVSQNPSDA
jgi:uncharacterized membrane protein